MIDSFKHKGRRKKLVEQLKAKGIEDSAVLDVLNQVPRHLFMNSIFEDHAYEDKAFPILSGQTISQPYTVAFQTELLQIRKGEKVLEIGTGCGYQTAVLVKLQAEVYSVERQRNLYKFSKNILSQLNIKPKNQRFGDGYIGWKEFAPYDKIIVTAGASELPKELLKQLKIGGIMVIPLGEETQVMTTILRLDEDSYEKYEYGNFQFVPMLKKKE